MISRLILVCSICISGTICLTLPSYVPKCRKSDPNLNECIKTNGNKAMDVIIKGDKTFKVMKMNPIVLPGASIKQGNLELSLKHVTSNEVHNLKLEKVDWDKKEFQLTLPHLEILAKYSINGQILILPIKGEGNLNYTLVGGMCYYKVELPTYQKDGKEFYKLVDSTFRIDVERVYFSFTNLFGGDPTLGAQINAFANENWKDFNAEISPAFDKLMKSVLDHAFGAYMTKVPVDELFDP